MADSTNAKKAPVFKFFVGSKSKVRTGCKTCKTRRIKCDETKPACNRCVSTGRHCDGYSSPQTRKKPERKQSPRSPKEPTTPDSTIMRLSAQEKVRSSLPQFPDCSSQESRYWNVFLGHSTKVMTPWHGGSFWADHVPRRGHYESATRHAVIALAATHENMAIMRSAGPNDPRMDRSLVKSRKNVVYQHYGRSVALLARELGERQPGAEENALVNCVIYIIVDFLWGNLATSIVHLQAGSNILKQWKKRRPKGKPIVEGSLEACLIAVYDTMGHQHQVTNIAARPATALKDEDEPPANEFKDLTAAKRSIEQISTDGMRLARSGSALSGTPTNAQEKSKFEAAEDAHNSMLQLWKYKFDALLSSLGSRLAPNESESINSMRLLYLSSVIWLWDVPQGANRKEEPLHTFDELIDVAEWLAAMAQEQGIEGERFLVSFYDSRVWPSIAIIATNCTNPDLKKRALGIMAKAIPSPKPNPEGGNTSSPVDDNWKSWAEMSK